MISWLYAYVQTHQIVFIKYLLFISLIPQKSFFKVKVKERHFQTQKKTLRDNWHIWEKKKLTNITKPRGNLISSKGDFRVQMKKLEFSLSPFVISPSTGLDLFSQKYSPHAQDYTISHFNLGPRRSFPSFTIKIKVLPQVLFSPKWVLALDSPSQWAQANEINSNLWPTYQWSRVSHLRGRLGCRWQGFWLWNGRIWVI